jgi:hypothetical protein
MKREGKSKVRSQMDRQVLIDVDIHTQTDSRGSVNEEKAEDRQTLQHTSTVDDRMHTITMWYSTLQYSTAK